MKKGEKGISDQTLGKVMSTGLLIGSLGGIFAVNKLDALDNEIASLKEDNIPAPKIQEMQETRKSMGYGQSALTLGETVGVAALGYSWGKRSRKSKEQEPESSR